MFKLCYKPVVLQTLTKMEDPTSFGQNLTLKEKLHSNAKSEHVCALSQDYHHFIVKVM